MPIGKKLVVVASVMATCAVAAVFFRKDASQVAGWQEALEDSPFRQRVERRVAADAAWAQTTSGTRVEPAPAAYRVPPAETAAISQQPIADAQPAFQKSFNPVGALLEPIEAPGGLSHDESDDWRVPTAEGPLAAHALEHRIADGDTLSKLAQHYLGQGERYLEIYDLNRNVLASPDLLPIGVVLKIPADRMPLLDTTPGTSPDQTPMERYELVPVEPNGAGINDSS